MCSESIVVFPDGIGGDLRPGDDVFGLLSRFQQDLICDSVYTCHELSP